jgi:hypothetical protein
MKHAARGQVVAVARIQGEEWLVWVSRVLGSIDERLVAPDDLGDVTANDPRGAFVLGDAK